MSCPGCALHEDLDMLIKVVDCLLINGYSLDILSLAFVNHLKDILGRVFNDG